MARADLDDRRGVLLRDPGRRSSVPGSRYIGGEWNQIVKDHRAVDVTFALGFPDVYEIGMSHLGYRILYSLLNSREDTVAESGLLPMARHGRGPASSQDDR